MSTIVTRLGKGSTLTYEELDDNFTNLNTDKLEDITGESVGDLSDVDLTTPPNNGQVLSYNSTSSKWTASNLPAAIDTLGALTDVTLSAPPTNGYVLTWNNSTGQWVDAALPASGISDIVADTTPQLGGSLDVNGQSIVSVSNGNITLAPNGTGKVVANNLNYRETIHSLGTTSGTIAPNVTNGNVQSITLNGNITFNGFTSPVAGQSVTLIINTGGTNRTLTSTMKFANADKTLSTTNTTDIISVYYDGTNYWASLSKGFA
jgi:hypothetical protein